MIACHVQPDGDAIGSLLAAGWLLRALGKQVRLGVAREDIPPQYLSLPGADLIKIPESFKSNVFIALDTANRSRLGPFEKAFEPANITINIDHHPDNPDFAAYNWVEPAVSSTSELIFKLWKALGVEMTPAGARCIYVGMVTDTGRWQYSNTSAASLRIAVELIEAGVEPNAVFQEIYENNSVGWMRLLCVGLSRAVIVPELELAYTIIRQADFKETATTMAETESIVDWLRSLQGVDVSVLLKETKSGEIKASVRSRRRDIGAMCRVFGGGGHKNAAGFTSKEHPDQIIEKVRDWLIRGRQSAPQ